MKPWAYYNEIDPAAAHALRAAIAEGVIAPGEVDERSIVDVRPSDIHGFRQCHFFAGGGLWSVAARLAGWPDERPIWTGSCPCQPFSAAGKRRGAADPRHLWPDFFRLICACRPDVVVGEQVAGSVGYAWLDRVANDLDAEGYTSGATDLPACAVNAAQERSRLFWIGVLAGAYCGRHQGRARQPERQAIARIAVERHDASERCSPAGTRWIECHDGKARLAKRGIRLLADAIPGALDVRRIAGNAIVPPLAAEVIAALMETLDGEGAPP